MSPQPRQWLHDLEHEVAALEYLAEKHGHTATGLDARKRLSELRKMLTRRSDDRR